jgi:UDP:flavonoid glycosyltransferase YjiC (YdhE family)
MARFTFLSWSGAGNQAPAIGAAQALRERDHHVVFAGYEVQRALFDARGFHFTPLETASRGWRDESAENMVEILVECVWASHQHLDDVEQVISDSRPDVMVVDCLMFGALAALEKKALPTVVLVHSAPGALMPPGGGFDSTLLGPVNRVRASAGRPHVDRLWDAWEPFPTFSNSIRRLDRLASVVPASFGYVGPIDERMAEFNWHSPWHSSDPRPLVLVSFSTWSHWDQTSRIRRTLEALAGHDCRVLVTGAGANLGPVYVPDNAVVVGHVPHAQVLPHASATITHAGHGTVITSLAHGVPLVCLPNRGADQLALARQVASLGVGQALDGDAAQPREIGEAVDQVLRESPYKAAAGSIAAEIAAAPGVKAVVKGLEQIASGARTASWT